MKNYLLLFILLFADSALGKRTFFNSMGRNYLLISPDHSKSTSLPLLVMLHGCKQNPTLLADGTQIEHSASEHEFMVLIPEQPFFFNLDHCWNWFLAFQQHRSPYNEMAQIIFAITNLTHKFSLDEERIFVAGMSAGGAMAHNLMTCYPDVFSGAVIHSGLNYKAAENLSEAQRVLTSYQQKSPEYLGKKMYECSSLVSEKKLNKVLIIHGKNDSRVPSFHSEMINKTHEVWKDYLDDGKRNFSSKFERRHFSLSYPQGYTIKQTDTSYRGLRERFLLIENLGHAWGGGKPVSVNFDPHAPSSNSFILDFLELRH